MSRFYKIVVGPETAVPIGATTASQNAGATWTNLVNGKADLGAQTVEFDIPAATFDAPAGQAFVRIWGPSKAQISQASDFNGAPISIYGGMQAGLPLATAAAPQSGILLRGQIFQAFANWQGITQTLDFVVIVDGGFTQSDPGNFAFMWNKGQRLGDVINQVLRTAFQGKGYAIDIKVSDSLVLAHDESGVYSTLQQFSTYVKGVSQDIMGGDYPGVSIILNDNTLSAFDGTVAPSQPATTIYQQDFIGQVTWLDAFTIQFNTVLRSDLQVGSVIKLPELAGAQAVTSVNSQSNARAKNTFQGTWTVSYMRHVGNSRAPDAQSWVSTFQAYSNQAPPDLTSVGNTSA